MLSCIKDGGAAVLWLSFNFTICFSCFSGTIITSVVPGDYDGDSQMDVLLTVQINSEQTTVLIFWGNNQTLGIVPAVNEWVIRVETHHLTQIILSLYSVICLWI